MPLPSNAVSPPNSPQHLAFIGLGTMGYPMAGHWLKAGHRVTVYNRNAAKAQQWLAHYAPPSTDAPANAAESPKAAAHGADVVCLCVGNDADVRSVVLGADGALAGMQRGAVLVDHTTASAELALELAHAAAQHGVHFLDAPVSGGEAGAQNGSLTIMCGGEAEVFARVQPVLAHYARAVTLMGTHGAGQRTKMVNQICIAGLMQGLSEALAFGEKAGLDMPRVLDVISKGAAQSWQLENRGPTMLQDKFDFGFALDWMRKDLGLVQAEAARIGAQIPITQLIDQFYAELQAQGMGRLDTSSLIRRLR